MIDDRCQMMSDDNWKEEKRRTIQQKQTIHENISKELLTMRTRLWRYHQPMLDFDNVLNKVSTMHGEMIRSFINQCKKMRHSIIQRSAVALLQKMSSHSFPAVISEKKIHYNLSKNEPVPSKFLSAPHPRQNVGHSKWIILLLGVVTLGCTYPQPSLWRHTLHVC